VCQTSYPLRPDQTTTQKRPLRMHARLQTRMRRRFGTAGMPACCLRSRRNREELGAWLHSSAERGEIVEQCIVCDVRNATCGFRSHAVCGIACIQLCCLSSLLCFRFHDLITLPSCMWWYFVHCVTNSSKLPLISNVSHIFISIPLSQKLYFSNTGTSIVPPLFSVTSNPTKNLLTILYAPIVICNSITF
jgi:hypothetical protein